MLGQAVLRIIYRWGVPADYYEPLSSMLGCRKPVVDVGGGAGWLGVGVKDRCPYYLLLDVDGALVERGWRVLRSASADVVVADAHSLPLRGSCCTVVLHDALHHFEDPLKALEESLRVMGDCILVRDVEASSAIGRFILIVERLLGFPARALRMEEVVKAITSRGVGVEVSAKGLIQYLVVGCTGLHNPIPAGRRGV